MVAFNDVQAQLVGLQKQVGFLGVPEVRKIALMLVPNEKILLCKKGWVNKKSTIICVTDKKIAFLDVKAKNLLVGKMDFADIISVFRTVGRFSKTVRIYTKEAALYFVVWRQKDAKELQLVVDRHLHHIADFIESTRLARVPLKVRDLQSWRSLVRRVGATSVNK